MVRYIKRETGEFEVAEADFLNLYYELMHKGVRYAYAHIQLALAEKFAYCHVYIKQFSAEIVREIRLDFEVLKFDMRSFNVEKVVGTKVDGIRLWRKFVKLIGFKDIGPSIINNAPCIMTVMEL